MAKITSVSIRRFKRLEAIELPLGDVTILIGANNAGKSSILQALHFAVSIAQTSRLIGEGVAWQRDNFELSFNPSQLLYSPVSDVLSLATGGALQEPRASQIEIELSDETGARCTVGLRRGRNRNVAVSLVGRQLGERLMDLNNPFTVYAPGLAGIPKEERYLSAGVVRRVVARGDANLALRNVLRMLRRTEQWDSFIEDMRSLFDDISIDVEFDEDTDEAISAYFQFPGSPRLQVDAAGTSILQASQILAYISLFQPQVLILDEPDSHLHPDNQRALCDLVFRLASERGFQALISTHSRHVLDAVKRRGSVVWLSRGRRVEESDLNSTAVLLELGALDSIDYFADGQVRCVVATEDSDREPIRALLWSNGFVENDTEVASYAGCSNVEAAVVLGSFLRSKAPNVRLVIHRDSDYLSQARIERFAARLRNVGVDAFVTVVSDVEGHFINAAHLNALNPGVTVERIEELIDQAIVDTREQSVEAIINLRTEEAFRRRAQGEGPPNHGAIATQAIADFDANPRQLARGKIAIGRLSALLQQELSANPRIFLPSVHLASPSLQQIANAVWPRAVQ